MTSNAAVLKMIEALERSGIPYMLVGSFSSNAYGVARSTHDADIVVQMRPDGMAQLRGELGTDFQVDPQMSFETVTATSRYIVKVRGSRFKIELFLLGDDPHDQARFARRRREPFLGREVYLPTAEDVIVTKLYWAQLARRGKDYDDARNVIAVQQDRLDWDYIHRWCDAHGTRALLDEIRRTIPQI